MIPLFRDSPNFLLTARTCTYQSSVSDRYDEVEESFESSLVSWANLLAPKRQSLIMNSFLPRV